MKTLPGAETRIRVVYPRPEQQIFEDSTFLMGSVAGLVPGARLWVNGQEVPLSQQGFFSWKIPVHAGMNPVKLEVRIAESSPPISQELFALYGVPPLEVLPAVPLAVREDFLYPNSQLWLTESDTLTVACSASVDAEVSLHIPGLLENPIPLRPADTNQPYVDDREMIFAEWHWTRQRIPTKGYYQLHVPISALLEASGQPAGSFQDLPMVLQLRQGEHTLEKNLPGSLTILRQVKWAVTQEDRVVTRTVPENGARLTPQRMGTRIAVDGLTQGWARARLSQDEAFYLPLSSLVLLEEWPPDERQAIQIKSLDSIKTVASGSWESTVHLIFQASSSAQACPVQIESFPSGQLNRLQVRLYGVCSRCDFIHYPPEDAVIRQIHWRQVAENVLELWIDLHRPLSGYDYIWQNGEWRFTVKALPASLSDVRVLIDPGHGGSETGSTGLNGLPEKDLNLIVSRLLRDALVQEGFSVSLTRQSDEDLSLQSRGEKVVSNRADIVLSIHHNALPDGRDPLKAIGASCFYYHAFSKLLADTLLAGLTDNRGSHFDVPNYGLFYDSLYMTRIHQATAVLVEIGFFTHPQEFERLLDPAFQREAARRLATAVRAYCVAR